MVNKQYKIKRYKNIYGNNGGSSKAIKVILSIAAVVLCCFLGWAVYEPVYNAFVGRESEEEVSSSADEKNKEESSSSSSRPDEESKISQEENSALSAEKEKAEEEKKTAKNKNVGGVFIPNAILNNPAHLESFLKDLKEKGCTSVVVEAKNAMGEVLYLSENETAIKSLAIVANAFDAKKVAGAIRDANMTPVAKIHGFRDGIAALSNSDFAVKYYDTTYIWLDNSAELGGRGWLNPYSAQSGEYIAQLAGELISAGFKEIIVDSLHYPMGVGREKMGFGNVSDDRLTAISASMKKIEEKVKQKGGKVSFVLNPPDYETDSKMLYGGDILNKKEHLYALTTSIDGFDSIKNTLEKINSAGREADIILLSYNYDGSQATGEKLKLIVDELRKSNVGSIYLFNPQGIY